MKIIKSAKFIAVILLILSAGLMSACGGAAKSSIIVAGSTSVQPYAEILAEEYAILYPGRDIDIQGGGSSAGINAVETSTADIGMSSRHLKESEQELWSVEIAKDGLAVIVNPKNPILNLTLEQVSDIYSGKITNWNELGGSDHKIHIITREDGSGTRSAFEELVMGESRITPKAIVQDSNGAVRLLVSGDRYAIGFISLGLVDSTVKAIGLNGVAPTRENVMGGSYSLFRPFLFVCLGPPEGEVKQFIDFTLSREGQQLLMHEGLIPVVEGAAE